jgi:hypothetical protein
MPSVSRNRTGSSARNSGVEIGTIVPWRMNQDAMVVDAPRVAFHDVQQLLRIARRDFDGRQLFQVRLHEVPRRIDGRAVLIELILEAAVWLGRDHQDPASLLL